MFRALMIAVLVLSGCKKKPPETSDEVYTGGFVDIVIEEDEQELFGSELMIATAECGDLVRMEPAAMMGKLKDGEIRCLDQSLREAERQTVKDKLSRLLLADAHAKGDMHRWEGIVRRHLEDIDRSDPDICYKFARYLATKDAEYADEAMRWADVALENRTRWTGDEHVKRVYALYKLKALSAQKLWQWQEERYIIEPSDDKLEEKRETRNLTKTLAREWLEYARSSGKDPTAAMQLCVSAAGTDEFCEGP